MKTISIPFNFTSDTGAVNTTDSPNGIMEQHILDILTTGTGERVMIPRYGASIKSLLFEELDPLIFAEYRMDAIQELNDYLTFGKVTDMSITVPNSDFYGDDYNTTLKVSVQYVVPPFDTSVVTFSINNTETTIFGGAD